MPFFKKPKQNEAALETEKIYLKGVATLKDIIAPAALKIESDYIHLGEKYARTFFVFTYPRFLNTNWFSPIIDMPKIFDISMFIVPVETTVVLKNLRKKVAQIGSQISLETEKGMVRDPILETAHKDAEDLRDRLQTGTEKFFKFGLYITVYGDSPDSLEKSKNEITGILESLLVYAKTAIFQQEQGFKSTLPLAEDKLLVYNSFNTEPLSTIFPFVSSSLTSDQGILYGINRHNNSLVLFDRFSLENANTVVFGKSGGGKSYASKLEILRSLMLDTEVIVIDPESEYQYLAETVGGSFFKISLSSPHHLNPFDLPIPTKEELPADVFRSNIINLVGLLRIMLGGLTPEEDAILDMAIMETYAARDITPDSDFSKITPPLMEDLGTVLSGMTGSESLARRLERFTKGVYSGFFNQPTNIDINKKLVVFSIRDMEEELRPMAMYIILHFIWNIIRSKLKKRILLVDEAWWLMKYDDGASFLFGIAKRARKYFLGLTTITQDVPDFMNSPYGKPILTNSSLQMLFKQSPATIDIVTKTFNLTDQEKYLLLESDVGEGLFFAGLKHVAIKVVASYTEDQVITSDPQQILAVERAKEELAKTEETQNL